MKPTKLKDIVEIIGIAAIVVSLIFVGLEIRQSAAATRGATQQALADAAREASGALVADEAATELTMRFLSATDWSNFSEMERFRAALLFTSMIRVFESAYYQWGEGNLAPENWVGWEASIRGVAPMPGVALFWKDRRLYFNEPFRSFFEEQMKLNEYDPSLGTLTIAPIDTL